MAKDVNVTDYGAKGDGEHDDTKAFERAFAVAKENGGGQVEIPKAKTAWILTRNIAVPVGVVPVGEGKGVLLLSPHTA